MHINKLLLLSAVTLIALVLDAPANAQTTVLLAEDNGWINKNSPDAIQPIGSYLAIRSSASFARKAYVKFDLSDLLQPEESFSGAELKLTTNGNLIGSGGTPTYDIYGIVDNNAAWTGTTTRGKQAPPTH